MHKYLLKTLIMSTALLSLSCTRPSGKDALMSISLPPDPNVSEKSVSAQAEQPAKFCYLVQIRGEGLGGGERACYPSSGIATELLPPLSQVQLSVARGQGRIVELFGYIPRAKENCQTAPRSLHDLPLNRLFLMGRVANINTDQDEVTVPLSISFPGLKNHLGITQQVESSCYAHLPPIVIGSDPSSPTPVQNGANYSLIGQTGSAGMPGAMKGNRYRIQQGAIDVVR